MILFTDVYKIPPGSQITKAYLAWPVSSFDTKTCDGCADYNTAKPAIDINRITMPWKETVTWNNKPLYDNTPVISNSRGTIVSYSNVRYQAWNITSLVQDWVNLTYQNFGLMLMSPTAETQALDYFAEFASSEQQVFKSMSSARYNMKPALIVEYNTSNPPQVQDVNSFCLSCHDGDPPPGVTVPRLDKPRFGAGNTQQDTLNVSAFAKKDATGDVHGGQNSVWDYQGINLFSETYMVGSYRYGMGPIQCTDCHEQHGSQNVFHFKKKINWIDRFEPIDNIGKAFLWNANPSETSNYFQWQTLCASCHPVSHVPGEFNCTKCHYHGAKTDTSTYTNF